MYEHYIMQSVYNKISPLFYGYEKCDSLHSFGPAVRSCYLIHYILSGKGVIEWEQGKQSVKKGDLFIIHPNEVTKYTADKNDPWEYSWLAFSCDEELPFLSGHVIENAPVRKIFDYFKDYGDGKNRDPHIFSLVFELLWLISQNSSPNSVGYASYAKAYFEINYMKKLSIEELAASLHIDRHYLCQVFKEKYGLSPQEFLMRTRLEKAQEFLRQGYTASQAALFSGFSDYANFSRKYKEHFGLCPKGDKPPKNL